MMKCWLILLEMSVTQTIENIVSETTIYIYFTLELYL